MSLVADSVGSISRQAIRSRRISFSRLSTDDCYCPSMRYLRSIFPLNTFMRFQEFDFQHLIPFQIVVLCSPNHSITTALYAESAESAWLLAGTLFGTTKIVSVSSIRRLGERPSTSRTSLIRFWTARLRKYARLASAPSKHYLLYRTRAKKAWTELSKLSGVA